MNNSAYAHRPAAYTTGEPAFTTFHAEFKGTVDYVWLTRETLRCSGERARESVCDMADLGLVFSIVVSTLLAGTAGHPDL